MIKLPGRRFDQTSVHQSDGAIKASRHNFELNFCQSQSWNKSKKHLSHSDQSSVLTTPLHPHFLKDTDWTRPEKVLQTSADQEEKYSCASCVHVIVRMHEETKQHFFSSFSLCLPAIRCRGPQSNPKETCCSETIAMHF